MTSVSARTVLRPEEDEANVQIEFAGEIFTPIASGALYWPARDTLLVADLHLEKLSSYAARGSLLPPYDTGLTLRRLERDLHQTGAGQVIALGDSFHRDEGSSTLLEADRLRLMALLGRTRWTWIAGNHDPAPHLLGGLCTDRLQLGRLTLVHEPSRGIPGLVAGHLHPAAHLAINGRSTRRPCFVHDTSLMILPAYGSATGTLNILSPAFQPLLDYERLQVAMIGRDRVYPVSSKRLVAGYEPF